MLTICDALILI